MSRIQRVQKLLSTYEVEALIIDEPLDIFYLTGHFLSLGRLVISTTEAVLFVDGRYFEACKQKGGVSVELTESYAKNSNFGLSFPHFGKRIGFDSLTTIFESYQNLTAFDLDLIPLKGPIKRLRAIKEPQEIELLQQAAELGSRGYDYILSILKEGVREVEISLELELFWRKAGGEKLGFAPIISFGENSAYPHYRSGQRQLQRGDAVLIDIGVVKEHYHSDMTRVVSFGKPSPEYEAIYLIVKDAQAKALEKCRPGVLIKDIDNAARSHIAKKGYDKFFTHSLGHGVGLEIHEFPAIKSKGTESESPLQEGMVVTIEPGIYLPGLGGVRLEDTIVITGGGYKNMTNRPLSPSLPIL